MNTRELSAFNDWDEKELEVLVGRYVRLFRRLPDADRLIRFRRAQQQLRLRIPAQTRRRVATLIATM